MADEGSSATAITKFVLENEVPQYPLQNNSKLGPKGAYEVKRENNGLYIRVDMPGVPSADDVKVSKKSEKCSITFFGKAPKHESWPFDDSERVFAGSICLDSDPELIPLEKTFKNGCLRLFLPGADGNLRFLTNKENRSEETVMCPIPVDEQIHHQPDVIIDGLVSIKRHKPHCRCCRGQHADIEERTCTRDMACINPSILQGVKSVFETKLFPDKDGGWWEMYFRLDMPDISPARMCEVKVEKKSCIIFVPMGSKEYPLDEGGRSYFCRLTIPCDCCYFLSGKAKHELKDGVMRMSLRIISKHNNKKSSTKSSSSLRQGHVKKNSHRT